MARFAVVVLLFVGLVGCAERKPVPRPDLPALPRSSIAAVLQRRAEVELTDEQVQKLQARDDQLATDDTGLHEPGTQRHRPDGQPPATGGAPGEPGMGGPGGPGGMGGMRMGGGGMHGGHHMGGGGGGANREARIETVQERRDANDTAAFTESEAFLTEAQRPKAEAIASEYREQLFHQREVLKQWRESQGGGGN